MKVIINLLCLVFLLLTTSTIVAQFSTYDKKGRVGAKFNGEILTKAKYDSVFVKDSSIATAYKGNKVVYVNNIAKTIFKRKKEDAQPFLGGMAAVRKGNRWGVIDKEGELLVPYNFVKIPERYGNFLFLGKHYEFGNNIVVCENGNLRVNDVQRVVPINEKMIVVETKSKTTTTVKRKFIGTKEVEVDMIFNLLYNTLNGELMGTYVKGSRMLEDLYLFKDTRGKFDLMLASGEFVLKNISEMDTLGTYYQAIFKTETSKTEHAIISPKGEILVPNKGYEKIEFEDGYFFAQLPKENNKIYYDVYSDEGELTRSNVKVKEHISKELKVWKDDSGCVVGKLDGTNLSDKYQNIFAEGDGMRRIIQDSSYAYINANDYQLSSPFYPFYFGTHTNSYRTGKGIFKLLGKTIYEDVQIVLFAGEGYSNGFAKIALNHFKKPFDSNETIKVKNSGELRFNFIDKNGALLNSEKYKYCMGFTNGRAWVWKTSYYYQIDATGKEFKSKRYKDVTPIRDGFYLIENSRGWGVMNDKFEIIVPCKYFHKPTVKNNTIEVMDGVTSLVLYTFE